MIYEDYSNSVYKDEINRQVQEEIRQKELDKVKQMRVQSELNLMNDIRKQQSMLNVTYLEQQLNEKRRFNESLRRQQYEN